MGASQTKECINQHSPMQHMNQNYFINLSTEICSSMLDQEVTDYVDLISIEIIPTKQSFTETSDDTFITQDYSLDQNVEINHSSYFVYDCSSTTEDDVL